MTKALQFASNLTEVDENEMKIIMHARKSLLFSDHKTWMKRNKDITFDVTMGSFDGAEVCELVGSFLLNQLSSHFEKDTIGLYRDDGLALLKNATGPGADRAWKDISAMFSTYGLKITAQTNLSTVDFLDVTLDMQSGKYKPYRKPGDTPLYVNSSSNNHPPVILKNISPAVA
eukprot:scpid81791/ scgid15120/ 